MRELDSIRSNCFRGQCHLLLVARFSVIHSSHPEPILRTWQLADWAYGYSSPSVVDEHLTKSDALRINSLVYHKYTKIDESCHYCLMEGEASSQPLEYLVPVNGLYAREVRQLPTCI